jgi:hypothetical protein
MTEFSIFDATDRKVLSVSHSKAYAWPMLLFPVPTIVTAITYMRSTTPYHRLAGKDDEPSSRITWVASINA